LKYNTNGNVT